jgi:hypothetical protein
VITPPSPRRRKLRLQRPDPPDDVTVVIRAMPADDEAAIEDIADSAASSAEIYVIDMAEDRELLYGVSVFSVRDEEETLSVLERFNTAARYLVVSVAVLRDAGFAVFATGTDPRHFDIQLVSSRPETNPAKVVDLTTAAHRLMQAAGPPRPNPVYAETEHPEAP